MILPLLSALSFFIGILVAAFGEWNLLRGEMAWIFVIAMGCLFKKRFLGVLILAFLFGVLRMNVYEQSLGEASIVALEEGVFEGRIVSEVDTRIDHQNIIVDTEYGRILAELSLYELVHYGDFVELRGQLEVPEQGSSYARYLFRNKVLYTMNSARVEVLKGAGTSLRGSLYAFKGVVQKRINRLYFEPEASLVSGLLLGSRKGMSEELTADFQAVGLTHIVAVSGYNISLVIAFIFWSFSFLLIKKRVVLSVLMVALFVLFVGASAAAVRAGIMGSLTAWGLYIGRKSQAFFALLWSAVLMTIWNPAILPFDIGFQLSFASTLGILVFVPILEKAFPLQKIKSKLLKEALFLTLSAQLATTPFIAFYFGRFSIISLLANLLVAPLLPFSMLFSALSLIGGELFSLLAGVYLKAVIGVVRLLAKIPHADIAMPLSLEFFIFFLCVLVFSTLLFYRSKLARAFGLESWGVFSKALNPQ
ncbi:MAG: ComEC/Rec2 family competence protein [Candidatus Gracilibacteria bacterium]|jgi:competence protein ComEC